MGQNIMAGAFAGMAELCCMYPLDVIKTRAQLGHGNSSFGTIISSLRAIQQKEGFRTLYRGISAPMSIEPVKRAVKFTANEAYKGIVPQGHWYSLYASGALAGMTECFFIAAPETVKVRMQSKAYIGMYLNTADGVSKILRQEGVAAFTRGFEPSLWRQGVWNGIFFGTSPFFSGMLQSAGINKDSTLALKFWCGVCGGILATAFNNPFDVVVSRARNIIDYKAAPYKYNLAIPSIIRILRTEGAGALFLGFPAKVLRLGPGGGIMMAAFELAKSAMQ